MVYSPTRTITSTTDLACPGLHCAIRQGIVQDVLADPGAAAFLGTRVYLREVPESQRATTGQGP